MWICGGCGKELHDYAPCHTCKQPEKPASSSPAGYGASISVKDRMPKNGEIVAVYADCDYGRYHIVTNEGGYFHYHPNRHLITHWTPLPDAP